MRPSWILRQEEEKIPRVCKILQMEHVVGEVVGENSLRNRITLLYEEWEDDLNDWPSMK